MTLPDRFKGCVLCGAIGDAWGSAYEGLDNKSDKDVFYPFGKPKEKKPQWNITDDTQLTLATIEAMVTKNTITADDIAKGMLKLYKEGNIRGIGASTLKALQELDFGGHWSQVGRRGEYAAGNGAAMRIAPIAFLDNTSNELIRDICSITHNNDEAYVGALCVVKAIHLILENKWTGKENLTEQIIRLIPDSRVRDRLILINSMNDLDEICNLGTSGYVVDSVPLAIAFANRINDLGLEKMLQILINAGGDTDTNCSIAGQIVGTLIGLKQIPKGLLMNLQAIEEYDWINSTIKKFKDDRTT